MLIADPRGGETILMAALRTLAGLVTGLAVGVGPLAAQVNEREMYVSVLDESGAPVLDLQGNDFPVREDGALREVVRVSRATAPIQPAILRANLVARGTPVKLARGE